MPSTKTISLSTFLILMNPISNYFKNFQFTSFTHLFLRFSFMKCIIENLSLMNLYLGNHACTATKFHFYVIKYQLVYIIVVFRKIRKIFILSVIAFATKNYYFLSLQIIQNFVFFSHGMAHVKFFEFYIHSTIISFQFRHLIIFRNNFSSTIVF